MLKHFAQNMVKTAGKMVGLKYDAANPIGRSRRITYASTLSEDKELRPQDRQSVISQGRDLLRNFTLAGFILRKHLQYIADVIFESVCTAEPGATPERIAEIEAFNIRLEEKMKDWQKRKNCDIAQRHCFSELLGLIETHRVFDGDVGILKVSGGRIQIIEGDRIRNPVDPSWQNTAMLYPDYEWVHGVKVGRTGRAFRYAICRRLPEGGFEFEKEVSADNLFLAGYFNRIDQVRGVSLLAPAIDFFSHLYEGVGYALCKMKLGQLLGIYSTHIDDPFVVNPTTGTTIAEEIRAALYDKFGPEIAHIVGRDGEKLEMISAHTPESEFQDFCVMTIRLVFAAMDIPYSFFDGSAANYYGQKGELDNYVDSCNRKQTDLIELLDELTEWLINEWVESGELELPSGFLPKDVRYKWTGAGLPYWRLIDDSKDILTATLCGLASPIKTASSYQSSIWDNIDDIAEVKEYARSKGVKLAFDTETINTNVGA